MDKKIWVALAVLVVLAVGAWALTSGKSNSNDNSGSSSQNQTSSTDQSTQPDNSQSQTETGSNKVSIEDFAFTPTNLSVKVGDTVTWTNNDSTAHSVTGSTAGGPDSGTLQKGDSYSFKFTTAGTYKYACKFHPSMTGIVTVQ